MSISVKLLCFTAEIGTTLKVNYISIKKNILNVWRCNVSDNQSTQMGTEVN